MIVDALTTFIHFIGAIFRGDLEEAFGTIQDYWARTWDKIKEKFENIWNGIVDFFTGIGDKFKIDWEQTWNGVKSFFENIWNNLKQFAIDTFNNLLNKIDEIFPRNERYYFNSIFSSQRKG